MENAILATEYISEIYRGEMFHGRTFARAEEIIG
jgi:hypothetical protein